MPKSIIMDMVMVIVIVIVIVIAIVHCHQDLPDPHLYHDQDLPVYKDNQRQDKEDVGYED